MTVRVQYQFVGVSDVIALGWTENWYSQAVTAAAAIATAGSPALVSARLALLGPDYRLSQLRCITVGNRSDTAATAYALASGQGTFGSPTMPRNSEQPWDAVLVKVRTSTVSFRNFPMRGIPTGVFADTFSLNNTPAWLQNFAQWAGLMTTAPTAFALRTATYPATVFPTLPPAVVGQRQISFILSNPIPAWITRGAVIRVRGVQGADNINHLWRVQDLSIAPTTTTVFTFPQRRVIFGTPVAQGQTAIDQVVYGFGSTLSSLSPIRGMKRSTGRPPALLRGRALVRRP